MLTKSYKLLLLIVLSLSSFSTFGQVHRTDQIEVELLSETTNVVPGETLWLAIRLKPIGTGTPIGNLAATAARLRAQANGVCPLARAPARLNGLFLSGRHSPAVTL